MRNLHRWIMTFAALFLLYLSLSGLLIQGVDVLALLRPTPANAPDLTSIKEYAYGPPYFSVLSSEDEQAPAPGEAQLPQQFARAYAAAAMQVPGEPIGSIELRVVKGVTQAVVLTGGRDARRLTFAADTGVLLQNRTAQDPAAAQSTHDAIKAWHRGNIVGVGGIVVNFLCGACLLLLCLSGIWMYWDMYRRRRKLGRHGLFWG